MKAPRYHVNVFWSNDDDCWIADVPNLKHRSAHGETPSKAVSEVQMAIETWLETGVKVGIPIPQPRYRPAIYAAFA